MDKENDINEAQGAIRKTAQRVKRKNSNRTEFPSDSVKNSTENHATYASAKKRKKEESLELQQKERLRCIDHFVKISMRYSQYLQKKLSRSGTSNQEKDFVLKYFENGELRPYQTEGLTWLTLLFENNVNGILGDEMGLGKTIQVIAFLCYLYERGINGPFLIVAPLSTLGNWEDEFARFAPQLPVIRLQGSMNERINQKHKIKAMKYKIGGRIVKPVVLTTYQVPLVENSFLQQFKWHYLIVDEGHRIKNPESALSLELRALHSENRLLLTGTPLQNNLKELWALFNFLMPDLFKEINLFSEVLLLEDVETKEKLIENETQTNIISTIHKVLAPFMLRREKKFVLSDLVPKKEIVIYCTMTELQKYLYSIILKRNVDKLLMKPDPSVELQSTARPRRTSAGLTKSYAFNDRTKDPTISTPEHVPVKIPYHSYKCNIKMQYALMMLKKAVDHPYLIWQPIDIKTKETICSEDLVKSSGKLLILDILLPKLKASGHKVLLFSTLKVFIEIVAEFFEMRNFKYAYLCGDSKFDQRNENIKLFNTDPDVSFFLITTRAGGLGLNLTAADTVIFLDRDWNPMADIQAQDRCHRIGQTKPVRIYSLICKNTIDEYILDIGTKKRRLEKLVIKEGEYMKINQPSQKLVEAELEELFEAVQQEITKVPLNGILYSEKEIDKILEI